MYDIEEFLCEDSRFLRKVTYNTETREMSIYSERNGEETKYTCVNVPTYIFNGFKNAKSKGKFFNLNVRGKYKHHYFN